MTLRGEAWHDARQKAKRFREMIEEVRRVSEQNNAREEDRSSMFVLIVGTLEVGVQQVIGPFSLPEEAEVYGEAHNLGHLPWFVQAVDVPVSPGATEARC